MPVSYNLTTDAGRADASGGLVASCACCSPMHPGLVASCACCSHPGSYRGTKPEERSRHHATGLNPPPGPLRRQCGYIQCGGSVREVHVIPAGAEYGVQIGLGVAGEHRPGYDDLGELLC